MFVPLLARSQLERAILRETIAETKTKRTQCPFGTVSARKQDTGEILFMTQVYNEGSGIFSNGDGSGIFFTFQPRVHIYFVGETPVRITINGNEMSVYELELTLKQ
jgi:hypothetical protein